jgi:hypothetical protein
MSSNWQYATIVRAGTAVKGSPFEVKLRYRRLHVDPQVAPDAARRPIQEFLIFSNILAPVQVGDTVTMPGGLLTKIIDVRSYASSLQCLLQRLPYLSMPIYVPSSASTQVAADKSLNDAVYVPAGTALALIEPHGIDQVGSLPIGQVDRRSCWVFSTLPLSVQTVLSPGGGDFWILTAASSVWQVSNDYRAPGRRLVFAPIGVT